MLTDTELIRKLDFFERLDQKIIKNIAKMCIVREFSTGDFIVTQGEAGLGLYFITRGRAKVEIGRNGVRAVVAELQEGDFLGEFAVIDDQARSADVICLEETSCLLLTRNSFSKLMNKHPEISMQMARSMVTRIRAANDKLSDAAPPDAASPVPVTATAMGASENAPSGSVLDVLKGYLPADLLEQFSPHELLDLISSNDFLMKYSPVEVAKTLSSNDALTMFSPTGVMKTYSSSKNKTKDFLMDLFGAVYVLKTMTRFSTAIMGCPVQVISEMPRPEVLQTVIDGVKLAVFPASEDQVLRIDAFGDGDFSAAVFRPARRGNHTEASVARFEGRVRKNETLRLHIPADEETRLEHA